MCFAPQRRALFRHLNFQKCSEREVFLAFSLANVLRATTACNFSSLIWPDGSAPAALASLLFDPPEPQIIGKTQCFATFLPFRASASSFFWLFLFSDLLSSTLLFSLTLPVSAFHLSIIVGSLTSKLNVWSFWTKLSNVSILQRALPYPNRIGKFANIYAIILISYLGPWGVFLQNLQRCKSYHIPGPQCAVCFRFTAHISDFIQGNMCRKTVSVPSSVIKRGWEIPVNWKFEWRNQSNSGWSIFQHVWWRRVEKKQGKACWFSLKPIRCWSRATWGDLGMIPMISISITPWLPSDHCDQTSC